MRPDKNRFRVLIVGCGELGSRHLQAVAPLPEVYEIEVVDPRPEALDLGRRCLAEVSACQPNVTFRWLSSLEEASRGGDLCIVATLAGVRCQLVKRAAESLGYRSFLLEKLVTQSVEEYERFLCFSKQRELSVWVNCLPRAHSFHQGVRTRLDPSETICLTVMGGNYGLATGGIHAVDLFAFYDEATAIEIVGSEVDPMLHPSRHGPEIFDLSGTIRGVTKKGSQFSLTYTADHRHYEYFSIATRSYRCVVDHIQRWAVESDEESDWSWRQVPFGEDLLVSVMGKALVREILATRRCKLPTLEECFAAHRFILGELQPHFSKLLGKESERCPVT